MRYLESEEWLRRWSRVFEAQSYCPYHFDDHVPPNRHCLFVTHYGIRSRIITML